MKFCLFALILISLAAVGLGAEQSEGHGSDHSGGHGSDQSGGHMSDQSGGHGSQPADDSGQEWQQAWKNLQAAFGNIGDWFYNQFHKVEDLFAQSKEDLKQKVNLHKTDQFGSKVAKIKFKF